MAERPTLTTATGMPVADNQNTITAGPRGPVLMQDFHLLEKLAHQNRERIPERTVHAKGSAAYGTLTVTKDVTRYTKVKALSQVGKKTEAFLRFSTVAGERGAADAERDVRGFALRFYTDEGNWDIVGNNTPVFFVRDPLKFPDFIHTQKRHPRTNMRSNTAMWDFWSLSPESLHQVTILMSDRGLPASYRNVDGFGSHTYAFFNAGNERHWVKFHFKTMQGIKNWTNEEAGQRIADDRETHQRDLYEAIERGDFPQLEILHPGDAGERCRQALVQPVRPHEGVAAQGLSADRGRRCSSSTAIPRTTLPRSSRRRSRPSNIVPGVGHSPDKMLQARIFSYADAHRYRLGINADQLPVNRPRCPVHDYHADGAMRLEGNAQPGRLLRAEFVQWAGGGPSLQRAAARHYRRSRPIQPSSRQ